MAREKASASKGCRSSTASPTPIAWTGSRNRSAIGDKDAALGGAVELGHDEAGDAGRFREDFDLARAFWPVVASSTSSTACGAVGIDSCG